VGVDQPGPGPLQAVEREHDFCFGAWVERVGRLVQHQVSGLPIQCARNSDPLPLPARQTHPAFADPRGIALRQCHGHEFVQRRRACSSLDFGHVVLIRWHAEGDIGGNGVIKQEHLLRDVGATGTPCPPAGTIERHAVDREMSG